MYWSCVLGAERVKSRCKKDYDITCVSQENFKREEYIQLADRREIWHAPQKLCKEKDLGSIFLKNCIFY